MTVINIGIGFMTLLAGRPAYAVFVAAVAYVLGAFISQQFDLTSSGWNQILIPLVLAGVAAMLTVLFRRWVARVAGFFAAGYVIYSLPQALGSQADWNTSLVLFVIAGIIAVVTLLLWFDFALIFLSTLFASTLIVQYMISGALGPAGLFMVMLIFGIITQFLLLHYGQSLPD